MLQHALPTSEEGERLQAVGDHSGPLVNSIHEMLSLTRVASRRGPDLRPQAGDVAPLCRVATASVRPRFACARFTSGGAGKRTVVHVWLPLASATTAGPATPVQ